MQSGKIIVGVDEVGRGAWAGPLLMGAVILTQPAPPGLTDSKLMTRPRREAMSRLLKASGAYIGLGWVPPAEIDEVGLAAALRLAAERAITELQAPYDHIVIDGTINFLPQLPSSTLARADSLVPTVSAASVIAKVARDHYMRHLHKTDLRYAFDQHVGYGTALHIARLAEHGPGLQHRRSVAPIKKLFA